MQTRASTAWARRREVTWLADVVCVLAFAAIGRLSHGEGIGPVGLAGTAWPFLVGVSFGQLLALVHRHSRSATSGLLVWVSAVGLGMMLRGLTGGGVELSFVVVTAVVLAVFLLGWRALDRLREPQLTTEATPVPMRR